MKKTVLFPLLVAGFILATVFVGCQNSPGNALSPTSDLHVTSTDPMIIAPEGTITSGNSSDIKLPYLTVNFNITNGISVFLESADVHYFSQTGQPLASGSLDIFLGMSTLINATALGDEAVTTTTSNTSNAVELEVYPYKLFSYMTNGTINNYADDITPVVARVTFRGKDVSGHQVSATTQVNIVTLSKAN